MAQKEVLLRNPFPFGAVLGQEEVKRALLGALADRGISTVLIVGGHGTGKTTIVRSLTDLDPSIRITTLPLNATEGTLFGEMDIERAIDGGRIVSETGLLKKADGGILLMDQINLFDESITQVVLEAAENKRFVLNNGGKSVSVDTDFQLVGIMDPGEGSIPPSIADRFEVCALANGIKDSKAREEIVKRRMDYEKDPIKFAERYFSETSSIGSDVRQARERLPYVSCSSGHMETVSRLCLEIGAEGHRGDIAMIKVSRCLAALDHRDEITMEDLQRSAAICLTHRKNSPRDRPDLPSENEGEDPDIQTERENDGPVPNGPKDEGRAPEQQVRSEDDYEIQGASCDEGQDVFDVGRPFQIIQFLRSDDRWNIGAKVRGKRKASTCIAGRGRYISNRPPDGKPKDIAVDATIRAAAPFQKERRTAGRNFIIKKADLREKVRASKSGTTILFLVDASGSMGARKRMVAVKGAIFSMLTDAYKKRDAVGMMTFANGTSQMLLPPTKSVDLAYRRLKEIPTGGGTPLPLALKKVFEYLSSPMLKRLGEVALVIVTDGRANIAARGGDAFSESLEMARAMAEMPVQYIVVDSEIGYPRLGKAMRLSEALGASYFRLEGLDACTMASSLNAAVHGGVRA